MILKVLKIARAFRRVQFENFQNHEYLLVTNCTRSTFNKITSFPWKLNRYSYGVQFGINCIALHQSKLSNFVGCTIRIRYRRENCLQVYNYKIKYHGWQINLKRWFPVHTAQSQNPNVYKHKRLTRWYANRCYSLRTT